MAEDIRRLESVMKSLACDLSQDEILEAAKELASTVQDIAAEKDEQKSIKSELAAKLNELESKKTQLASKIQRKTEWRQVEVYCELDFEAGLYRQTRSDTGEVIFEREITSEERQEKLIIDDVDADFEVVGEAGTKPDKKPAKAKAKAKA